jgi:Flp pilus assembly protein TadB
MAKASKKRSKKKSTKRKSKARKPAKRSPAKRKGRKRAPAKRKSTKRKPAKRKPAKRKPAKHAPAPQSEPWPMIFAVLLAFAVALIAGWHFNGPAEAAGLFGNLSPALVGELRATDTWLTIAHPHFIPTLN